MSKNSITVDGVAYVRADSVPQPAEQLDGMKYVIVRTYSAGVFAGHLKERDGKEATLLKARRLWYWRGAASLSQLAMEGVTDLEACKFPCEVDSVTLTEVVEVLDATQAAQECISKVKTWKA